jgi:diguanylate cyclase (GGDEF)-like protein
MNDRTGRLLKSVLTEFNPELHRFGNFDQLTTLASRKFLDLIYLPYAGRIEDELALVKKIKNIPVLAFIPLVMQHPGPSAEDVRRLIGSMADEILEGSLSDPIPAARLRMAVHRSFRDVNTNPSSRLPGPVMIEKVLRQKIDEGSKFAVCYADLDDFKAYNDYYGYFSGDKVIKMTSRVIRNIVYRHQPTGFVGHIAGDDFIFIIDAVQVKSVCSEILKEFDRRVPEMYEPRDLKNGFIITKNRRGSPETYPIMTLSIAVLINKDSMFSHVGEISHMIADLKNYTKTLPGSNYVIERRAKY